MALKEVITVCDSAKKSCPVFPGKAQKLYWSFIDPVNAVSIINKENT